MTSARTLGVILLSPPTTAGTRTIAQVAEAARLLDFDAFVVVNLFNSPTRTSTDVGRTANQAAIWKRSRRPIRKVLAGSAELLCGWGLVDHLGQARDSARTQVDWFVGAAWRAGHGHVWTVGADVRHPSRWHQYTADRHGRTTGGSRDERLKQVLQQRPIESLRTRL